MHFVAVNNDDYTVITTEAIALIILGYSTPLVTWLITIILTHSPKLLFPNRHQIAYILWLFVLVLADIQVRVAIDQVWSFVTEP